MASIASLWAPTLDAASGKIPILSDSSVEEASPVILSFPGKKGNEERQEFYGEALHMIPRRQAHSAKRNQSHRKVQKRKAPHMIQR